MKRREIGRLVLAGTLVFGGAVQAQALAAAAPTGYPAMVEASKSEHGLLVYVNLPDSVWKPQVVDGIRHTAYGMRPSPTTMACAR